MDENVTDGKPNLLLNKNRWQKQWQTVLAAIQQLGDLQSSTNEGIDLSLSPARIEQLIDGCYKCFKVAGSHYPPYASTNEDGQLVKDMFELVQVINTQHNRNAAKQHQATLSALSIFATAVVEYFMFGFFGTKHNSANLKRLQVDFPDISFKKEQFNFTGFENPKDFLVGRLLKQLSTDVLHLEQTFHLQATKQNDAHQLSRQLSHTMAQVMVRRALHPALHAGILGQPGHNAEPNVLTYPTNAVQIRSVPYRNDLFIGFPITAFCNFEEPNSDDTLVDVTVSTAYLTLAHEVGHFVYRQAFEEKLKNDINGEEAQWLGELFSDVYCSLVEGPIAVVGFQELLESEDLQHENELLSSILGNLPALSLPPTIKHSHPPGALRPFIFSQIIRLLTVKSRIWQEWGVAEMANDLDDRWIEWIQKSGGQDTNFALNTSKIQEFREALTPTLQKIIDKLIAAKVPIYEPEKGFIPDPNESQTSDRLPVEVTLYNQYCLTCAKAFLTAYVDKEDTLVEAISEADALAWFKTQFEERKEKWEGSNISRRGNSFAPEGLAEWLMHHAWSDDGPTGGQSGRQPTSN